LRHFPVRDRFSAFGTVAGRQNTRHSAVATPVDLKPQRAEQPSPRIRSEERRKPGPFARTIEIARLEPLLLAFVAGGVIARIVFWATTNRMFEDGLTTITHARNVPLGLGLVHHPGEGHIHGFTSALGVLIPLVGELIHEGSGMTAIRLASLVAVSVAIACARFLCRDIGVGVLPTAFVLAYIAFDQNAIFYGMAGMETEVAVAVIVAGIYFVRRKNFVVAGICLGLAPLARPEFVLWVAPALAYLAIANVRLAAVSASIAAAIVAPWIAFTTLYYGSPIPHTIVAKSALYPTAPIVTDGSIVPWFDWLVNQLIGHLAIFFYNLMPFEEVWNTVSTPIPEPVLMLVAVVAAYFLVLGLIAVRGARDMWPALAFIGLFFAYWVYFLPVDRYFAWYLPPFLAVVMIFAALGMQRMSITIPAPPRIAAVVLAIAFAIHMPFSFGAESKIQSIEDHVRTNVGLYLRSHVQPGESVMSESAGYVGFYSGTKLYDFPGLTSNVSLRALETLPPERRALIDLISVVKPDWIVVRPWELSQLQARFPEIAAEYQVQKVIEMPGLSETYLDSPGTHGVDFADLVMLDDDMKFTVLKRSGQ
jgi:hypothetical protein